MSTSDPNMSPAAVISFEGHPEKLRACLRALSSWVSPIIIIHSGSDKHVKQIAEEFKLSTSVCNTPETNANWNAGLAHISKEWVLLIRSNEVITGQLRKTIVEKIKTRGGDSCKYPLPTTIVFLKKRLKYSLDWHDSELSCLAYLSKNTITIRGLKEKLEKFTSLNYKIIDQKASKRGNDSKLNRPN